MANLIEIGEYIKATRKKRKLKITDLADAHISSSTVSNVEKGMEGVSDAKRIYLCEKLNLNYYDIPRLIQEEKDKKDQSLETLKYIEKLIDLGNHKAGLQRLRKLNLKSEYIKAVSYYLRGKSCIVRDDDRQKAKKYFEKSIQHIDQSDDIKDKMNIRTTCYNQIANIYYYDNDLEKAVYYTNLGIDAYKKAGEKKHLIFALKMNKALFLDKLGYRDEATTILDDLWTKEKEINRMTILTNMYDIQANFLIDAGMCSKGIEKAKEGLEIAQINKEYNRVVELLLTIGKAYMKIDELENAKEAFTVALDLENQVKQKHLFLPIYTCLGKIYMMQNEIEQATTILESAINVKTQNHHIDRYIDALATLADSFHHQGYKEKSFNLYQQALELSRKHRLLVQQDDILFKMCVYYSEKKEKHYELLVNKIETELKLKNRKG